MRYSLTQTHRRLVAALQCAVLLQVQLQESTDPGKLGRAAFVSMVESAHFPKLHHRSEFSRLYRPRDRRIFLQGKVRASPLVIFKVRLQHTTQTGFIEGDDVVQALATNRSHPPLNLRILPE